MIIDNLDSKLSSYDFHLPKEHIAQIPVEPRHNARMLIAPPVGAKVNHARVWNLIDQLNSNDLLVVNNTKVLHAKLMIGFARGGRGELLLVEPRGEGKWLCLGKPGKYLFPGSEIKLEKVNQPIISLKVLEIDLCTGGRLIQFPYNYNDLVSIEPLLNCYGEPPLPPYIIRDKNTDPERYQTRYATTVGAVAAPTAGLHFSDELLGALKAKKIDITSITLHVGLGTFRPLDTENLTGLRLHSEWVEIAPDTVAAINACRQRGGNVIAIGTTTVRALEGSSQLNGGKIHSFNGRIETVIQPGYKFTIVDGILTNFHFPKSSLLLLVSAFIGRTCLLQLYQEALGLGYRFFSYGDAMWIPPQAVLKSAKSIE